MLNSLQCKCSVKEFLPILQVVLKYVYKLNNAHAESEKCSSASTIPPVHNATVENIIPSTGISGSMENISEISKLLKGYL